MNERLVAFLYLLIRDSLPTGEVERLVREAERSGSGPAAYSGAYLESYARQLAERLRP